MNIVERMLEKYSHNTDAELTLTLREVMQEIALAGLYRQSQTFKPNNSSQPTQHLSLPS